MIYRDSNGRFAPAPTNVGSTPATRHRAVKNFKTPSKKQVDVINIAFLLDASESMYSVRGAVVSNFNEQLAALKKVVIPGQKVRIGVFSFSSRGWERTLIDFSDINSTANINLAQYWSGGSTALYDAIEKTVQKLKSLNAYENENVSYVVQVLTDGHENNSANCDEYSIKRLISELQATDRWTFAFQGPKGCKQSISNKLGIPAGNITEWETTEVGVAAAAGQTYAGTQSVFQAKAAGINATRSFYETNLTQNQDLSGLIAVTKHFSTHEVPKETDIRNFCEEFSGVPYTSGRAFYELTKNENVQGQKELAIQDKKTKKIYRDGPGNTVRGILGLPVFKDVKVVPGDHSHFRIYVQSTSQNRKLVRGTRVLWAK